MILVFGTVCIDRLRRVPHLPATGGYVEVEDERSLLGGEAANTANALVNWGHPAVLACNPLGAGVEGELLREMVSGAGLQPVELLAGGDADAVPTPICDIYITPDGERTMFGRGFSRLESRLSLEAMPIQAENWFTAEPNMEHASREAVRAAITGGMRPYLMDFIRPDDPVAPGSFWQSSTDWAGHRNNMQRNVAWVKEFVGRTGAFAILSDGPNGFVAGGPDHAVRTYPPFPAPRVVDTTGAGDLFRAGMLHGLDSGWPLARCLQFASAAGCLKCQYLGATTRVPTVSEIEAHIVDNSDVAVRYG